MKFSSIFDEKSNLEGLGSLEHPTMLGPCLGGGHKFAPLEKNPGNATAWT